MSNHGRASTSRQDSSHDEAVQRPRRVWASQPLRIQRSGHGNLVGDDTREATDEVGASGLRAYQRHAHFDLEQSDELERMPQHLFSATDAGDDTEYDQVEQRNPSSLTRRGSDHGAKSTRDKAVSMEGHDSATVNRAHEDRTRYIAQASTKHDRQAEAPRSTSPGLQVKANGAPQTVRTSSEVQQQLPDPRQSSLFQFYPRKSDKIAGNPNHNNSHKVRQMDGSQLALDETTAGVLPNADTPGSTRRGSSCESLARESEIDDEMWDVDDDTYEDAEDKLEPSALGKRKAKAGRVLRCDSGRAQGLKCSQPHTARRGGSASTAKVEFPKNNIKAKRTRPTRPCHQGEHAQAVNAGRRRKKLRSRKRCQYPEGCDKIAIGRTLFCVGHGGGKRCQYPEGCAKIAIGRTLFCVGHGGGKRCQYPEGCDKSAIGRTFFCVAHGGGRRCQYPDGCDKSAEGRTMFCVAHGGGKRCQYPDGCDKGADGRTMFCKAHGGGKRCQYPEGCGKSAQGSTMFCKAHGGGKRCQYPDGCDKSALGSTMFCTAHGGGKRCQYPEGCDKGARSSTKFCAAHGGGKRCQYPEGCDRSAEGRTLFCKTHGGGKRCQYPDGCDKSAQGATLFCIAHGGGKRCQYPDGCDKSAIGRTSFCKAHGGGKRCQYPDGCGKSARCSTIFCVAHGGGKRCQYPEGCGKSAIGRTLFCVTHGGGKRCRYPGGCEKSATRGGLCRRHGSEAGLCK
jgi:hypothetical protein